VNYDVFPHRTKEIHFSLPPLRSTSLGDLAEPDDSDVDTESLLLPTVTNQRSNSFSKAQRQPSGLDSAEVVESKSDPGGRGDVVVEVAQTVMLLLLW
jgi:hypothetical protein